MARVRYMNFIQFHLEMSAKKHFKTQWPHAGWAGLAHWPAQFTEASYLHHMTLINFPVIYDTKYYLKAIWLFLGLIMGIKLIYKLLSMG